METTWLQLFAQGGEAGAAEGGQTAPEAQAGLLEQQPEEASDPPEREDRALVEGHWRQVDKIYDGWMEQAEALKQLFPGFDIRQELADARFAGMLKSGVDLSSAYQALHAGQILPAAMEYAARSVEARLAEAMRSGFRPGENGLSAAGPVLTGRNVSAMTRQDYAKICRMVERGERVSFG